MRKRYRWWSGAALVSAVVVLPLVAQGPANGAQTPRDTSRATLARQLGADLYQTRCADCHGETAQGKGDPRTSLLTPSAANKLKEGTAYDFRHAADVRHPHATLEAPTEAQLAAIGAYIRETLATPLPDGDADRGAEIYQRTCSVCHGEKGNGASWARNGLNPAPVDFTSPKAHDLSRLHMVNTVAHGSPKTAMMGFATQLSREEIVAVVDYIRSTFMFSENDAKARAGAAASGRHAAHGHADGETDMAAALPNGLSGDVERGQALYRENCVPCHGKKGDGKGPRAYFMFRKPADFSSAEARGTLNRPHLFSSIAKGVVGTEMPAWSKVLTEQQIADVAEYVFTAFIRPEGGAVSQHGGEAAAPAAGAGGHDHSSHSHAPADGPAPVKKNN